MIRKSILSIPSIVEYLDATDVWNEATVNTTNSSSVATGFPDFLVEAGYTYWYRSTALVTNSSGGSLTFAMGHFATSGSPVVSSHTRASGIGGAVSRLADTSLTTVPTGASITNTNNREVVATGVFVCTTGGIITPLYSASGVMAVNPGASFRIRRKVTLV